MKAKKNISEEQKAKYERNWQILNNEIDKLRLKKIKKGGVQALIEHDEQIKKWQSDRMWEKGVEWMVKIIMVGFVISLISIFFS